MQLVIKRLTDAVGLADTIEIVKRWGGREFYIPRKVEPSDPLALTLGIVTAKKLVDALGGTKFRLPIERNALLDLRNEAIVTAYEAGVPPQQIALDYGMTVTSVKQISRRLIELRAIRNKFADRKVEG